MDVAGEESQQVYLLNASAHCPAVPSGMQNLQTLFGLDDLAASVARVDSQGNKIAANKLNKTYKKQILDLGVPGGTDIPKNSFLMDALMAGVAHQEPVGGYQAFSEAELHDSFDVRPGPLNGYVKFRPPSPPLKRVKVETPRATTPVQTIHHHDSREVGRQARDNYHEARSTSHHSNVPILPPVQTRSSAQIPSAPASLDGEESSDDGSRFKELERERKKKLRMKREAEMAMGGDHKRRRYDVDGYEFLDSD